MRPTKYPNTPRSFKGYSSEPKQNDSIIELILIGGILFCLGFVLFWQPNEEEHVDLEPSIEEFYRYPLQAWQTTDLQGGDCIKVKYKVQKENTRLYMYNSQGKIVHMSPISLDPFKDGRERIETYVWKLYRTEWTSQTGPGEYQIVVGTDYDRKPFRNLNIEIDIL